MTDCLKTMSFSYFSDLGSDQPKPLAKFQPDSGRAPFKALSGIFKDQKPIVALSETNKQPLTFSRGPRTGG
jgi:hypothetical protein